HAGILRGEAFAPLVALGREPHLGKRDVGLPLWRFDASLSPRGKQGTGAATRARAVTRSDRITCRLSKAMSASLLRAGRVGRRTTDVRHTDSHGHWAAGRSPFEGDASDRPLGERYRYDRRAAITSNHPRSHRKPPPPPSRDPPDHRREPQARPHHGITRRQRRRRDHPTRRPPDRVPPRARPGRLTDRRAPPSSAWVSPRRRSPG